MERERELPWRNSISNFTEPRITGVRHSRVILSYFNLEPALATAVGRTEVSAVALTDG